jgi:undecaprenyl-diphosphatase
VKTKTKVIITSILLLTFITITFIIVNSNPYVLYFDNFIRSFIAGHQSPVISNLMLSITKIGNMYESLLIFLAFGLFLLLKKHKDYFYALTVATSFGIILPELIKTFVQRVRPDFVVLTEYGFSFPSSHATMATIFLLSSVFLLAPLMKRNFSKYTFLIASYIIFPLIAFSRIYLSVHWTSDVIAGIILGAICFVFSETICCQKKENVL